MMSTAGIPLAFARTASLAVQQVSSQIFWILQPRDGHAVGGDTGGTCHHQPAASMRRWLHQCSRWDRLNFIGRQLHAALSPQLANNKRLLLRRFRITNKALRCLGACRESICAAVQLQSALYPRTLRVSAGNVSQFQYWDDQRSLPRKIPCW